MGARGAETPDLDVVPAADVEPGGCPGGSLPAGARGARKPAEGVLCESE